MRSSRSNYSRAQSLMLSCCTVAWWAPAFGATYAVCESWEGRTWVCHGHHGLGSERRRGTRTRQNSLCLHSVFIYTSQRNTSIRHKPMYTAGAIQGANRLGRMGQRPHSPSQRAHPTPTHTLTVLITKHNTVPILQDFGIWVRSSVITQVEFCDAYCTLWEET
jgi:hypothetical protein